MKAKKYMKQVYKKDLTDYEKDILKNNKYTVDNK